MGTDPRILLSIHLTSNRPQQFVEFLDRLGMATDDPRVVEVIVKIDADNQQMKDVVTREQPLHGFRIKYISTPLEGGFFGLWKCYDHLLGETAPSAYFVVNLNDEMYFVEKGWDTRLQKYVDIYPDGIYRLRVSFHRERNTFDYWEASCSGELTPIITKKWLDLSGGWCPCNGPDSFQNAVAFYFGWLYRHDTFHRPYRERIVDDLEFSAQGSNLGLTDKQALLQRTRGALLAWFELVSYPMQQEAARRAQLLHAHVWAAKHEAGDYDIRDDSKRKTICLFQRGSDRRLWSASYRISRVRVGYTNFVRKFRYAYYCGAGENYRKLTPEQMRYYFLARYDSSLTELPDLGFSPSGNLVKDSLPYRYLVAMVQIISAYFLGRPTLKQ